jgi:hypothetical protein
MAYEPSQLALFEALYPQVGWTPRYYQRRQRTTSHQGTVGHGSTLVRGVYAEGKKVAEGARRVYGGRAFSWFRGTDGWLVRLTFRPFVWFKRSILVCAAGILTLIPVHLDRDSSPVFQEDPTVTAERVAVTKIYSELAPKMFEKADPSEVMKVSQTIYAECKVTGVDPRFIIAIIEAESNFDVEAVSGSGARGLMQIMPSTFKEVSDAKRMFDPSENVRAGIRYVNKLFKLGFNTPEILLHAYNQGPGAVREVWRGRLEMSEESRAYIPRVMNNYKRLLEQDGVKLKDARKQFVVAMR